MTNRRRPEARTTQRRGDSLHGAAPSPNLGSEERAEAVIDDDHADPTLIEWMLDRSPEGRLEALQGFVDSIWELRGGSKT